mmetsp:Transcript_1399/g.1197  ORF Transcript_1399/g.1197 Transcript_1399/m.1197 type:complete len:99 (+) Transcript_1399:142-438(+)
MEDLDYCLYLMMTLLNRDNSRLIRHYTNPKGYVIFQLVIGIGYILYLHRAYSIFLLTALLINKLLIESMLRKGKNTVEFKWVPAVMWLIHICNKCIKC